MSTDGPDGDNPGGKQATLHGGGSWAGPMKRGFDPRRFSKQKARAKLNEALVMAVDTMVEMAQPTPPEVPCGFCGRGLPESEKSKERRLKAAGMLADRNGFGPHSRLEIVEQPDTEWLEYATDDEAEMVLAVIERCRGRMPINDAREVETVS